MAMERKVKITVLRRECFADLQREYLADPDSGKCPFFEDSQEFIVDNDGFFRMMHGKFCAEAWDCISRYVYAALQGGSIMRGWTKDENVMIACCNDGTRPVVFKIERLDGTEL
ncbi:MAG: TIGR04076 family protein [Synergistaceae bacterium]|nr:TIGR04076 family protein [Synergistaceae bacterium]